VHGDSEPFVSVLIPCYNAEKWIAGAIRSALTQTYPHKEVIVVDDGSTDGSLDVIRSFSDAIRWETGPNRGANAARNRLLELSRGEWLQYLDADDYLLPDKLAAQMRAIRESPCDIVVSPCLTSQGVNHDRPTLNPWLDLVLMELGNTISNLWRARAIRDAGGWNENAPCGQECELMLRMLEHGARVTYFPEPLAFARSVNPKSVSKRAPRLFGLTLASIASRALDKVNETELARGRPDDDVALRLLRKAQRHWFFDRKTGQRLAKLALKLDPSIPRRLARRGTVYGKFLLAFGFTVAQWYLLARKKAPRLLRSRRANQESKSGAVGPPFRAHASARRA